MYTLVPGLRAVYHKRKYRAHTYPVPITTSSKECPSKDSTQSLPHPAHLAVPRVHRPCRCRKTTSCLRPKRPTACGLERGARPCCPSGPSHASAAPTSLFALASAAPCPPPAAPPPPPPPPPSHAPCREAGTARSWTWYSPVTLRLGLGLGFWLGLGSELGSGSGSGLGSG